MRETDTHGPLEFYFPPSAAILGLGEQGFEPGSLWSPTLKSMAMEEMMGIRDLLVDQLGQWGSNIPILLVKLCACKSQGWPKVYMQGLSLI